MNRDALINRIQVLRSGVEQIKRDIATGAHAMDQLRANLSATEGAAMECEWWLRQIPEIILPPQHYGLDLTKAYGNGAAEQDGVRLASGGSA